MLWVGLLCIALLVATTIVHYEALRFLNFSLPRLRMPARMKLVLVILGAFGGHAIEVLLYAGGYYGISVYTTIGTLGTKFKPTFEHCLYFSAETFTSLGYGDVLPTGSLRMLAGIEAMNGLLLIGWTASFVYISMTRFWVIDGDKPSG